MKNMTTWKIGDKIYNLKLTVKAITELEKKVGGNVLNPLLKINEQNLPSLSYLLLILHAALQKFNHGVSFDDVCEMYSDFTENGGTLTDIVDLISDVFKTSGLIPQEDKNKGK